MDLTPTYERFCQEYLVDLNGSAAYARVHPGCAPNTAKNNAWRLLRRPEVAARIAELQRARAERTTITADWVLERLKQEAEFAGTGTSHAARVAALALAMRHLGMFADHGPDPDRTTFDLSKLTDEHKVALLLALRSARQDTN